jgi:hypothetical protein
MWDFDSVAQALGPAFDGAGDGAGFACEATLPLADQTIGFGGGQ